jgi:hypothetical protein
VFPVGRCGWTVVLPVFVLQAAVVLRWYPYGAKSSRWVPVPAIGPRAQ